jgi:hypothetical protein
MFLAISGTQKILKSPPPPLPFCHLMKRAVRWERTLVGGVFETRFCYVAQAVLELKILLPQLPKCWDYRRVPPHPALG